MLLTTIIALMPMAYTANLPTSIKLQGKVRDFSNLHPDFESPVSSCKEQTGLLLTTLTQRPDGRPIPLPPALRKDDSLGIYLSCSSDVVNRTKHSVANYGQFFLEEYYQDVPGVNIVIPIEIELQLVDESLGLYRYNSDLFLPINDSGYVREKLDPSAPLDKQIDLNGNYWFTTEFKVRFYYRGVETFQFVGDDDLWVFIDGQLTSCDLGSIHNARSCTIDLQTLDLTLRTSHEMSIFHAERHWKGSSFQLTTSIVPENEVPIAPNMTIYLMEDVSHSFTVAGFDPDYNPGLRYMIVASGRHGQLNKALNEWIDAVVPLTYSPAKAFSGADQLSYIMNDQQANSTRGYINLIVNPVNNAPQAQASYFEMTVDETAEIKLAAQDIDTNILDLSYSLLSSSTLGYASVSNRSGLLVYRSVNPGLETLHWEVSDGFLTTTSVVTIKINSPVREFTTLEPSEIAGIAIGGFFLIGIISAIVAFFLFRFIAAAKFQASWEREFAKTQHQYNPLYRQSTIESSNPLYEGSSGSINRI